MTLVLFVVYGKSVTPHPPNRLLKACLLSAIYLCRASMHVKDHRRWQEESRGPLLQNVTIDAASPVPKCAQVAPASVGAMVYFSFTVLWHIIPRSLFTTDSVQIKIQSALLGSGVLLLTWKVGELLNGIAITSNFTCPVLNSRLSPI